MKTRKDLFIILGFAFLIVVILLFGYALFYQTEKVDYHKKEIKKFQIENSILLEGYKKSTIREQERIREREKIKQVIDSLTLVTETLDEKEHEVKVYFYRTLKPDSVVVKSSDYYERHKND
jgi:hypothetical protein